MKGSSIQVQEEILLAKESRREGNEGRARVCARRAAGAASRDFLERLDLDRGSENLLTALEKMKALDALPPRVLKAINRLMKRVDEFYNLPPEIDLIEEAEVVIRFIEESGDEFPGERDG